MLVIVASSFWVVFVISIERGDGGGLVICVYCRLGRMRCVYVCYVCRCLGGVLIARSVLGVL